MQRYTAIVKFFTVQDSVFFFGALEVHFVHRIPILDKSAQQIHLQRERVEKRGTERLML